MKRRGRPPHPDILTPREWEALELLRRGLTNEQIAQRLGISMDGAKYHVSEILSKLGVSSRQEAATWQPAAARPGWAAGLAPVGWLLQRLTPSAAMKAAGVTVVVAAAGGLALLGWAVLTTEETHEAGMPLSQTSSVPGSDSGSGLPGYTKTTFPAPTLHDLALAPDGIVLAATGNSVARFDGAGWSHYPSDGLTRDPISTVEVAPDGTVWAGGGSTLARLDGETWTTAAAPSRIRDLAIAPDGSVVARFDDLVARFDGETWTPLKDRETLPQSYLTHTALDVSPVDGAVWVGTGFWGGIGSVSRFDGSAWPTWAVPRVQRGSNMGASAMTVAPDGSLWVMLGATLTRASGEGVWSLFPLPIPPETDSPTTSMAVGSDGTVWISRWDGLLLSFDGSSWTMDSLGENPWIVWEIEVAPDGTLWVGTDDSLVRLTPP